MSRLTMPEKLADMQRMSTWNAIFLLVALLLAAGCDGVTQAPQTPPGPDRAGSPSWSPDGSRIIFYSEHDGNAEIYVMDVDGANRTRLTNHPADEGYPAFSPDGQRISFDSDRDESSFEIYTMNADGSDVRRLTYNSARDVSAAWAPDGSQIAWMSDRSGRFEIWLMNPDGSNQHQFTDVDAPSLGTHWFPQWSPDGEHLAFHVERDVHTVRANGSDYIRLTVDPNNGMVPSWTPEGHLVFMSWRAGTTEIYKMNADGSDVVRLTYTEMGESIDPRVSPDGSKIAYTWVPAGGAGSKHLMLMNIDGTDVKQLTETTH